MSTPNDPVLIAVLSLSPEERSQLADRLLSSLHEETVEEIDPTEAEHRIEALRRGDADLLDTYLLSDA